jgi:hypothetical protein
VCDASREPSYLRNDPGRSQWISATKDTRPGVERETLFTFQTEFDLTGFDASSVTVVAQVLADNGVHAIRLNGAPVSFRPWKDNEPGQPFVEFRPIEIASGFVSGLNQIEIDVQNGVYAPADVRSEPLNPMALRVEWTAFGRLSVNADPLAGPTS